LGFPTSLPVRLVNLTIGSPSRIRMHHGVWPWRLVKWRMVSDLPYPRRL